ncbi:MAG: prolyl oligopeptidase family serine peptidase [Bacteroidota bacterium]
MKSYLYFSLVAIFALLMITNCSSGQVNDDHPGKFLVIRKNFSNSNIDGYNLYVPNSCTKDAEAFPVIVFLQGGLGVGGDVSKIMNWGLPMKIKETKELKTEIDQLRANTFVVIMPHMIGGQFYDHPESIDAILDEVIDNYNVDESRIYLTGLSRGGYGTWGIANKMRERFAAIAPIAGGPLGSVDNEKFSDLPIWVAHNPADNMVKYRTSKRAVNRIEEYIGAEFHKSKTVGSADFKSNDRIFTSSRNDIKPHDAWTEMYNEPNFYKWLLRFKK